MKIVAIILAGGTGQRFGSDLPKQFVRVNNKPIIIHTLENFQKSEIVNNFIIVCLKEYVDYLKKILKKYNMKDVKVIEGGNSGPESTQNGINYLRKMNYEEKTLVIIHDANRPFINKCELKELIETCLKNGNAVSAVIERDLIMKSEDGIKADEAFQEYNIYRIQKPECYYLKDLIEIYNEAKKNNISNFKATCFLYMILNKKIFFSKGNINNIKITYKEDIELMKRNI